MTVTFLPSHMELGSQKLADVIKAVGRNRLIAPLRADPYANGPMCRKPPQMAQCAALIALRAYICDRTKFIILPPIKDLIPHTPLSEGRLRRAIMRDLTGRPVHARVLLS